MSQADAIITALNLSPHPEGGYFRETFRDEACNEQGRSVSTAILYLLKAGELSHWHRVDATEVWHWYAGAPLELKQREDNQPETSGVLGNAVLENQSPQIVVPAGVWQSAQSLGDWTLVGCTVAPGFEFSGFEMAPIDGKSKTDL